MKIIHGHGHDLWLLPGISGLFFSWQSIPKSASSGIGRNKRSLTPSAIFFWLQARKPISNSSSISAPAFGVSLKIHDECTSTRSPDLSLSARSTVNKSFMRLRVVFYGGYCPRHLLVGVAAPHHDTKERTTRLVKNLHRFRIPVGDNLVHPYSTEVPTS